MPITDTSWIVIRHPYAFLPTPWLTVLCARDLEIEVLPGIKERRSQFVLDAYTGQSWHREGTGKYTFWSDIPPLNKWCPREITPPLGYACLFWLMRSPYLGLNIGRVTPKNPDTLLWQIKPVGDASWQPVISKAVGGWLLLPTDSV